MVSTPTGSSATVSREGFSNGGLTHRNSLTRTPNGSSILEQEKFRRGENRRSSLYFQDKNGVIDQPLKRSETLLMCTVMWSYKVKDNPCYQSIIVCWLTHYLWSEITTQHKVIKLFSIPGLIICVFFLQQWCLTFMVVIRMNKPLPCTDLKAHIF